MPQMRYVFLLEGVEWDESVHGSVWQGGREEKQAAEGGVVTGEHGGGLPGLQDTLRCGDSV